MDSKNTELVDLTSLRELLGENTEGIREILGLFVSMVPGTLNEVKTYLTNNNLPGIQKTVHSMKVYYGYVGNTELYEGLDKWEVAIIKNTPFDGHAFMEILERKTSAILDELKEILK